MWIDRLQQELASSELWKRQVSSFQQKVQKTNKHVHCFIFLSPIVVRVIIGVSDPRPRPLVKQPLDSLAKNIGRHFSWTNFIGSHKIEFLMRTQF